MINNLTIIDAPCGSGKSYQIEKLNTAQYGGPVPPIGDRLTPHPTESPYNVCAIMYRRALAITFAEKYGLVAHVDITSGILAGKET